MFSGVLFLFQFWSSSWKEVSGFWRLKGLQMIHHILKHFGIILGFVMKDLHCLAVELHFFGLDGLPCLGKKRRNEVCLIVVPVGGFLAKLN